MLQSSFSVNCSAEENTLTMLRGTVMNGMKHIMPTDTLEFEFNHRIDPCDNSFTISGGSVSVTGWTIKGTVVQIRLSASLSYGTQYVLNLGGLSDIYFEEYPDTVIAFETEALELLSGDFVDDAGKVISTIDTDYTGYSAKIYNHGEERFFWIAMTLINNENGVMEKCIFKKINVESNSCCDISEGFSGLDKKAYTVKVFYIENVENLIPYNINSLKPMQLQELT